MDSNTKLWRLIFSLFKLMTTAVALIIVIGGVVIYAMEPMSLLIPHDALVMVLAGGSVTALISFISFLVIGLRKRTDGVHGARVRWIVLDALLMAALAVGFIFTAFMTIGQSRDISTAAKQKFSDFWENASPMVLTLIQKEGQCCGFGGYDDRVLEPCKKYSEAVGCWTVLRDEYAYYLHLLTPSLLVLCSLCIGASVLALLLLLQRLRSSQIERKNSANGMGGYYDQDEAFQINRSQPFDAWHKAVFAA